MNLEKLFEMQRKLNEHIVQEKGLEGQKLLDKKILALQVELGELANEWRGFKFWKEKQEPIRYKEVFNGKTNSFRSYDPLLEEYVDCLHFILSIGLEIGEEYFYFEPMVKPEKDITSQFTALFKYAYLITEDDYCSELITSFVHLGVMFDFTWKQIEQAYMSKNQTNHERQQNGY